MDFSENDLQKDLRALTRKFCTQTLQPHLEEDERQERFRPEWIAELGKLGLTGLTTPEDLGGAGVGMSEAILVIEELARASLTYAISVSVTGLPQAILNEFGTPEQKRRYIPALAQGNAIGAFGLSEPESGSDAGSLRTTAKKSGGKYLLSGTKFWITQADVAEVFLVMARTGDPGAGGVTAFILEKGMKGLRPGKREKKMGMNASHTMELILDQVEVPETHRIGKEGEGFKVAMSALNSGRINIGACAIGIAKGALEVALHHAKGRKQFGQSIGAFQGISFLLADMATTIDAAELLVHRAAWLKDQNRDFSKEASMAKYYASDVAMEVTTQAVQILGGSGYTTEFPVERYMREAKVLQIVEGTNQIQRWIVGKNLMKDS